MRKLSIFLLCGILVFAFVDYGHAFLFFKSGGSGKGGKSGGGVDTQALFKQDFSQFGVRDRGDAGRGHQDMSQEELMDLINAGSYPGSRGGEGPGDGPGDNYIGWHQDGQGDRDPQSQGSPVPEPATMALFGLGLIGLSWVVRKKS